MINKTVCSSAWERNSSLATERFEMFSTTNNLFLSLYLPNLFDIEPAIKATKVIEHVIKIMQKQPTKIQQKQTTKKSQLLTYASFSCKGTWYFLALAH